MKKLAFVSVMAALIGAYNACSAASDSGNSVGVSLGAAIPLAKHFDEMAETGAVAGGQVLHSMTPGMALGAGFDYFMFGKKSGHVDAPGLGTFSAESDVRVLTIEGLARFSLNSSGAVPYIILGLGLNSFKQEFTVDFLGTSVNGSESSSGLAASGGAGLDILLNTTMSLGLEAKYRYFKTDEEKFGIDNAQAVSAMARLSWLF